VAGRQVYVEAGAPGNVDRDAEVVRRPARPDGGSGTVDVGADAHLLELAHVAHGPLDLYLGLVAPDDVVVAGRELHPHASFGRERTLQGVGNTSGCLPPEQSEPRSHRPE